VCDVLVGSKLTTELIEYTVFTGWSAVHSQAGSIYIEFDYESVHVFGARAFLRGGVTRFVFFVVYLSLISLSLSLSLSSPYHASC